MSRECPYSIGQDVEVDQACAHQRDGEIYVLLVESDKLGQYAVMRFQAQPSARLSGQRLKHYKAFCPACREMPVLTLTPCG